MRTVGILNEIKMQYKSIKFNIILYIISWALLAFTFGLTIVNLIYNPVFINSLVLEISIVGIIFCGYSAISGKRKLDILKEKELEIKIRNRVNKRYI